MRKNLIALAATLTLLVMPATANACTESSLGDITGSANKKSVKSKVLLSTLTDSLNISQTYRIEDKVIRKRNINGETGGIYIAVLKDKFKIRKWWHGKTIDVTFTMTDGNDCKTIREFSIKVPK